MTSTSTKKAPAKPPLAPGTVTLAKSGATASFQPELFDQQIRDIGYLLYWSSGELCPCRSNSTTEQADPTCTACEGSGYVYLLPDAPRLQDYNTACIDFVDRADAKATQGIITSQTQDVQIFEKFGEFVFGAGRITTFSWNSIGHRDRFEHMQALMTYRQVLKVPVDGLLLKGRDVTSKLRYKVVTLLRVFKLVDNVVTDLTADTVLKADGTLDLTGADVAAGQMVSVSYRFHPIWIVTEFALAVRNSRQHAKTTEAKLGKDETLPVHSFIKLDFLL